MRSKGETGSVRQVYDRMELKKVAGPSGHAICRAFEAAREFLRSHDGPELLPLVGKVIRDVPKVRHIDKAVIQESYYGGSFEPTDDLLAGRGPFYITEQRKLFLDCTAGHYQMTWGYEHPVLTSLMLEGIEKGVVWDNHSNIPQWPVKRLARKLVELANPDMPELVRGDFSRVVRSRSRLNTVLIGLCTGSVACGAGLKIMLFHYQSAKSNAGDPVIIALDGNYHGTDFLAQRLRGMWPGYFKKVSTLQVQPNDISELRSTFERYGERVAGFWAEPIMMNREAIKVEEKYLQEARRLCTRAGALMAIDEIQTGFWWPEVFMFHRCRIRPDMVIVGKGMTAGFHPLSAVVYRRPLDCLDQYDAISTNGNAALAALVALGCMELVRQNADRIDRVARYYFERLKELPQTFPSRIEEIRGEGFLAGIKFKDVHDALAFHKACVGRGLWVRAHAYHEGHSTVLTKLGLCVDQRIVDFLVDKLMELLRKTSS